MVDTYSYISMDRDRADRQAVIARTAAAGVTQLRQVRSIAAITQGEVISKSFRHLKRAADPLPIAPARARQETFDGVASTHAVAHGLISDVHAVEG